MNESRTEKSVRSINFGRDVLDYLTELSATFECSRSFLINAIVREHATGREETRGGRAGRPGIRKGMPERLK